MSRQVTISDNSNVIPSGYTGESNLNSNDSENSYHDHNWSNNYTTWTLNSNNTSTVCYVYYTFDTSEIPSNATITSVTAIVKAYRNNRVTQNTAGVQLYANTTAKGTAVVGTLGTSATTVNITNGGSWTRSELNNLRIRLYGVRSNKNQAGYLYFYGGTVTINYTVSGTEYEISFSNTSENVTSVPSTSTYIFENQNTSIDFYNIQSLDDIEIVDNSNDIIDSLVFYQNRELSTTLNPNSLVDNNGTVTDINNGLSDELSTTYAQITSNTAYYMEYSFDTSSIPQNAEILSISCIAKVECTRIYSDGGFVQLYNGTIAKGSSTEYHNTSTSTTSTINLNVGTWTRTELNDVRIRIWPGYTGNYYVRFYGASLYISYRTINENVYVYTISNIAADHLIKISELSEYYLISGTSTLSGASFSNLPKKIGPRKYGTDYLVNLTGISNVYSFVLYDNGVDVTRFVDNYQYPIQNIYEDHVLLIEEANYFSVTGSSSVSGISIIGTSNKVYENDNITVIITGVSNIHALKLTDNNVEVSANIEYVNNSYQYTIEDIDRNHTLTISQQDRVTISTSSSYSGATLTSSVSSIYKGESVTLTLNVSNIGLVSVRVNNKTMITGLFEGNGPYTCTLTDIRENLSIVVIEKVTYNITATDNSSFGNITPTGTTNIDAGYEAEYFISSEYFDRIYLKDNGVIVNDSIEHHYEHDDGTTNTVLGNYTLVSGSFNGSGATFFSGLVGQGENASTTTSNYYSSGSGSIVVFNYDLTFTNIPSDAIITRLYVRVNGHAESTSNSSEYMCAQLVIGDTAISDELNFKDVGTSNSTQTIEATTIPTVVQLSNLKLKCRLGYYGGAINGATCYIEYYTEDEHYSYTISNISETHTLVLSDRPTYQLTSSSTAQNGTITPSSITVYERNSVTFVINTIDIFTVSLSDNGANVTENIVYEGGEFKYVIEIVEGTHTLILSDKLPDVSMFIKINGQYITISKIYKKISGAWVEQATTDDLFDNTKVYINR